MNTKNRLIKKLLKIAKKHKILTYPVLAFVAIISFFGNLFNWKNGKGKRVVAVIMAMVLFVSQSCFLTSSATALVDTEEEAMVQLQLQEEESVRDTTDADSAVAEENKSGQSKELVSAPFDNEPAVPDAGGNNTSDDSQSVITSEEGNTGETSETDENVDTSEGSTEEGMVEGSTTDDGNNGENTSEEETQNTEDTEGTTEDEEVIEEGPAKACIFKYQTGIGQAVGVANLTPIEGKELNKCWNKESNTYDITALAAKQHAILESPSYEGDCYKYKEWKNEDGSTPDLSNMTPNDEGYIILYSMRDLEKYKVYINKNIDANSKPLQKFEVGGTGVTASETEEDVYYVPKAGNMFELTVSRFGYKLSVKDLAGEFRLNGFDDGEEAQKAIISFTGDSPEKSINLYWEAATFTVRYASSEDGEVVNEQNTTYDGSDYFLPIFVDTPEGCKHGQWRIGDSDTYIDMGESGDNKVRISEYQDEIYKKDVILYPVFDYDDELVLNRSEDELIEYQYKVENLEKISILARYKNGKTDFLPDNGNSKNGYFTYTVEGKSQYDKYGIVITDGKNGVTISTQEGGTIKVTDGVIPLKITVADSNPKNSSGKTYSFTIKLKIKPVTVTATPTADANRTIKTFNGNTICDLSTGSDRKVPSDVTIDGKTVYVAFDSAEYESPEVSENARIILNNPRLSFPEGISDEVKSNYTLYEDPEDKKCYVIGAIRKRPVYLKTYADLDENPELYHHGDDGKYVRTGDPDPTLKFEVDTSANHNTDSIGIVSGYEITEDDIELTSTRTDLMTPGDNYKVDASVKESLPEGSAASNYEIVINDSDKISYRVVQESPEGRYEFTSEATEDNWFGGQAAQIRPMADSGYDTIHISKDGETDFASGAIETITEADFPRNTPVYVKLTNSTGAETSWQKIDVNVDTTAPEFISYELSYEDHLVDGNAGGLYFPTEGMTTFGSYFNKTVTAVVKYKDVTSGPKTLYYGLFGNEANQSVMFNDDWDEEGYRTATFEIAKGLADAVGQVVFKAEDTAGNMSTTTTLKRNDLDQWCVESTGPQIKDEDFYVVSKPRDNENIYVVSGSNDYYTKCKAFLTTSDNMSGIRNVIWHITDSEGNTTDETVSVDNKNILLDNYTFTREFPKSGEYRISATVTDNAGNTTDTSKAIQFKVDNEAPDVNITTKNYNQWQQEAKIEFTAYDELSGIRYINVTDEYGNLYEHEVVSEKEGVRYCSFKTDKKGIYKIIVADYAGNVSEGETLTVYLDKISKAIPNCPQVTLNPEKPDSLNGWYKTVPIVTIGNVTKTADETPVTTKYQLSKEGETPYNETSISSFVDSQTVEWTGDGVYNLKVWSESYTGVSCEGNHGSSTAVKHDMQIKVDTKAPIIEYSAKSDGSVLSVHFTVKDNTSDTVYVSGVNEKTIKVLQDGKEILAQVEKTENGYIGSFEITTQGNYTIEAADLAGNVAEKAAFTPMSMKVRAVTNITAQGATIGANVVKGTAKIASAALTYRKLTDEKYTEAEALTVADADGNITVSSVLNGLSENTAYAFKVTATSELGEILEYEGYFKTLSDAEGGTYIIGTARYANASEPGKITVGLFEGNVCIMAVEVDAGDTFTFDHVPDGNYSIVATDGKYSKTKRVLIKDGLIVYPESVIELVLSGKNTAVVIVSDDTPNITADNMDSIFANDTENFTVADRDLIESDGTVEFKLYASLMRVSTVKAEEISAMYAVTDKSKVVGAYLDLSLYKIITDANGNTERTQVHQLTQGANVSVTIPLGDLAGKSGLEIVRIHDNGDRYVGASLQDMDSNPNTYTISTGQFSTYAVLYNPNAVIEDQPATVPSTLSNVGNGDLPIQNTTSSVTDNTTNQKTESGGGNIKKETSEKTTESGKRYSSGGSSSVGTLRSSGTAKTGDMTPIAALGFMMLISTAGFIIIRKKNR